MMGTRQKLDGDGIDITSKWRRLLCRMDRAGVTASIKRRLRRQRRRAEKRIEGVT